MMISKRSLSRRTMLKALGASVPLPLLDAMVPAMTALRHSAATPALRFGAVYVPNGVIPSQWYPTAEGAAFEFTPTLKPLEGFRERLMVISGLDSIPPPPPGERQYNNHADASTRFLTDVTPSRNLRAGVSIDQIAARVLSNDVSLPSLELALESVDSGTSCDFGRSCVYTGTIAWAGPTQPLHMEHDPSAAFVRLFGDSANSDSAARRARMQQKGSILDSLLGEVSSLRNKVAAPDRTKLSGYLEAVRDVERRIQKAVEHNIEVPAFDRPAGVPETFEQHAKLMFDIQLLAYQGDVTRVVTFMLGREFSGRTYPEIGVPDAHHPISHHQRDPVRMEKCAKINHYHASLFAYFLDKMKNTPDGDGSLLDHTAMLYGAGMSEGNGHVPENLPILLVGGAAGKLKGGRHIKYPKGTPLANFHLSLLDKLGVRVESHGNSTGPVNLD
ncbi:MAG TPA: DUF1552 domain-containing protein [Vicinamibacterales bacterium]|nr:DUF1552 domain-containing protein [Vicinamibacterales bacterium]